MTSAQRPPTPVTWRGEPVPWVVRWTGETIDPQVRLERRADGLAYHDERSEDRRFGVLWYRNRTGRGGEPELTELHTGRLLACMTRNLCQVCGGPATDPHGRIQWLFPRDEWELLAEPANPTIVTTPPTCRECWPLARRFCPHLRATGTVGVSVAAHRPVAVYGDLYDPTGPATPCEVNAMVPLTTPARRLVLGKQLVVELSDIRTEPSSPRKESR
ncbi:hypothetical protein OG417_44835 [Actinoallomurus sp. NBC_01490]|uniref:hypothetical protein n=1 Tax=Actinoallomurus sp. NBC_01490 TaxID=2903557 RepID=UPI002E300F6A|nr:hypothetical protein [Actinoallomurus sp. NBC_01490]